MSRFQRLPVIQILLGLGLCLACREQAQAQYGPYPAYAPAPYYPAAVPMPYASPPLMSYAPPAALPAPAAPPPAAPPPPQAKPATPPAAAPVPVPAVAKEPAEHEPKHGLLLFRKLLGILQVAKEPAEHEPEHGLEVRPAPSVGINMLGRGDFLNRFNIFDNMSALPENRAWFTFDGLDRFRTGFGFAGVPGLPLTQRRVVYLYRGGAEVMLGHDVSLVAQGEYVASGGSVLSADAWSNPQAMVKWAVLNTDSTVITPVLAFSPETTQTRGQLHERVSRLTPGVLFFQELPCDFFVQGGMQFNIALGGGANTFDYALSLGNWLYRHSSLNPAGRPTDPYERAAFPFVTGVVAQVELLGEHVINNAGHLPYDPNDFVQSSLYAGYREPESVYNLTVGITFLLFNHVSLSGVYSTPISGGRVSDSQSMGILNIYF